MLLLINDFSDPIRVSQFGLTKKNTVTGVIMASETQIPEALWHINGLLHPIPSLLFSEVERSMAKLSLSKWDCSVSRVIMRKLVKQVNVVEEGPSNDVEQRART